MSASWVLNHRLGESTTFLPTPFMPNPNGINQYGYDPTSSMLHYLQDTPQ